MKPISKKEARELERLRAEIPHLPEQPVRVSPRTHPTLSVTPRTYASLVTAADAAKVPVCHLVEGIINAALDCAGAPR